VNDAAVAGDRRTLMNDDRSVGDRRTLMNDDRSVGDRVRHCPRHR